MNLFWKRLITSTLLALLVLFSFGLRFYQVATAPSGVQVDEASLGFNAFSILQTGKDEHGVSFPIVFQAFGDQKLPAYIYSMVPFVKVFGLNNLAVRLPAVIVGTLITIAIFFLLRQFNFSTKFSLFGSLITAVSPWQIILSRVFGYESNLGLLFFMVALLLLVLGYKKNKLLYLILSAVFFGFTWYSYIAYRLISPLILLCGIMLYAEKRKLINLRSLVTIVCFSAIIFPLLFLSFSKQTTARLGQTTLVPNLGIVLTVNENRNYCSEILPNIFCYANNNKLLSYAYSYVLRYIYTYSPDFLFATGDKDSHLTNVDNAGLFPIILFPFYLFGIMYLSNRIIEKKLSKNEIFLIIGLMISPLPAVIADLPQKIRLTPLFPFLIILMIYGAYQIETFLKNNLSKKTYYFSFILLLLVSSFSFLISFLTVHIHKYEDVYDTFMPKLMTYLYQQDRSTQIYINFIDESILYYAYVNKIDPQTFQKEAIREKPNATGIAQVISFQNIHTTNGDVYKIYCQSRERNTHSLFVTNKELPETLGKAKKIITSENGVFKLAFVYDLNEIKIGNANCSR